MDVAMPQTDAPLVDLYLCMFLYTVKAITVFLNFDTAKITVHIIRPKLVPSKRQAQLKLFN